MKAILFAKLLNKGYILFFARICYPNRSKNGLQNTNIVIERKGGREEERKKRKGENRREEGKKKIKKRKEKEKKIKSKQASQP